MPGVLIEDMPFTLDSVSAASSPFYESPTGFYTHHHQQLSSVASAGELTGASVPAIINSTTSATTYTGSNYNAAANNSGGFNNSFRCSSNHQQPSLLETFLAVSSPLSSPSNSSMESLSPRGAPHDAVASALHRFLPSNNTDESTWSAEDVYSCDEFRMFEFKVRRCMRGRSHDWTECPFAHPGEKARRRDPRRFHYSGTACPDFRKGNCKNGDACELAHGVFECWLHPARYRTQPCKDGRSCKRRVCFFAHTAEQLRLLSTSSGSSTSTCSPASTTCVTSSACIAASDSSSSPCSSPRRSNATLLRSLSESTRSFEPADSSSPSSSSHCCCSHTQYRAAACCGGGSSTRLMTSPTSTLVGLAQSPPPLSPPLSPTHSPPMSPSSCIPRRHFDTRRLYSAPSSPCSALPGSKTVSELVTALQQLELQKSLQQQHNSNWVQCSQAYSPSPLRPTLNTSGMPCGIQQRGVSLSLPATPTKPRWETMWEMDLGEEDLGMEGDMMAASLVAPRVESGRDLRAKIYGRLAGRGSEGLPTFGGGGSIGEQSPDLNWVNDLVMD